MKKSKISIEVELDDQNVPEKIVWDASDKPDDAPSETRSLTLSLWDHSLQNTMRIDLWTKDMTVDEMKRFYIDSIGGLAMSLENATGDKYMTEEIQHLCDKLIKHVEKELKDK